MVKLSEMGSFTLKALERVLLRASGSRDAAMNYRDRIVLITGGNSGIGRAFVDRFVEAGARVFTCGRNARTLGELRAAHPGSMPGVAISPALGRSMLCAITSQTSAVGSICW